MFHTIFLLNHHSLDEKRKQGTKVVHFEENPGKDTVISTPKGLFRIKDNKVAPAGKWKWACDTNMRNAVMQSELVMLVHGYRATVPCRIAIYIPHVKSLHFGMTLHQSYGFLSKDLWKFLVIFICPSICLFVHQSTNF